MPILRHCRPFRCRQEASLNGKPGVSSNAEKSGCQGVPASDGVESNRDLSQGRYGRRSRGIVVDIEHDKERMLRDRISCEPDGSMPAKLANIP